MILARVYTLRSCIVVYTEAFRRKQSEGEPTQSGGVPVAGDLAQRHPGEHGFGGFADRPHPAAPSDPSARSRTIDNQLRTCRRGRPALGPLHAVRAVLDFVACPRAERAGDGLAGGDAVDRSTEPLLT